MKQKKKVFGVVCKAAAVLTALSIAGSSGFSYALIDETNTVHIDASSIENATLIIGSHLIYMSSMNDQIYEKAMKSAEEANQYQRYYKSELAGGIWYDITDAGALADITTAGIVVEDKVIEELFMTHHTKSDGITYDLKTGASVSIFNIDDPYDLEELPELDPIKLQYDVLVQTEDPSDTIERDIEYIEEIYKFDRKTDKTRELDRQIESLQKYYEILVRDGADSDMSDVVMSVMEKLDAARRVEVLSSLNDYQLQKMSQVVGREFTYLPGEITGTYTIAEERAKKAEEAAKAKENGEEVVLDTKRDVVENFVANTDLITAISEAMTKVQESYTNYSSKMLTEGTTVLSRAEYRFSKDLIGNAEGNNYAACDMAVKKLIYLDRINNSIIREEEEERSFIALELLEEARKQYVDSVGAGAGEAYQTLSTMAAEATRTNVLKEQLSRTDIIRNELQFIMQAYMDRMTPEDAMKYITGCMDGMDDYRSKVKADVYETYANTSIDFHAEWMKKTVKNLQGLMGGSELDALNQKKQDLQTQHMAALDQNRLDEAKRIEAQIEAVDKEREEIENDLNAVLNSENASASEKALAAAKLGDGSTAAAIQDFKDKAIEEIKNGNLDDVSELLEGIGALSGELSGQAVDALKDVYQELVKQELMGADSDKLGELMSQVEGITAEQTEHLTAPYTQNNMAVLIQEFVEENMGGSSGNENESAQDSQSGSDDESTQDSQSGSDDESTQDSQSGSDDESTQDSQSGSDNAGSSGNENDTTKNNKDNLKDRQMKEVMDSLDNKQLAVILAGLSMYAEQNDLSDSEKTIKQFGNIALNQGNEYVFEQLQNHSSEYLPMDKLSKIIGYRYIFNDSQKEVTIQRGSQYYKFKAFSTLVQKGTESEEMSTAAEFQGVIYIPEDTAQEYFSLAAESLNGTSYGIILTEEMQKTAAMFAEYLLEAGEEL